MRGEGGVTRYLYDGLDILVEYDGAGAAGNKYTHGPGIDSPLALEQKARDYILKTHVRLFNF